MSETDLFPLNPDYVLPEQVLSGVLSQSAGDGSIHQRLQKAPQRLWELEFRRRSTDEAEQMRDWYARFQNSFFRWSHSVYIDNAGTYLPRDFPVHFAAPPSSELVQNEGWTMRVQLIEAVGKALPSGSYPDPTTGHPSFFIEEDDAQLAAALRGIWTSQASGFAHAGNHKANSGNTSGAGADAFQFIYAGYGFRIHNIKGSSFGIYEIFLDEISLGTVDLYNATSIGPVVVFTKLDINLGLHRVEIRSTNTKNAASTNTTIFADAIEVMP